MIAKHHKRDGKSVLALCDENIHGQIFEDNNLILDLTSNFFAGEKISEEKISPMLKLMYIINAVGKNSTELLIKEGLIEKKSIKTVAGIPHVQILNASL